MGKLRVEAKNRPFMSEGDYNFYLGVLRDAQTASKDNHTYYDLEKSENPNTIRKAFLHVAQREGITVNIRRERGANSLTLNFREPLSRLNGSSRMSAAECRKRIMGALSTSQKALQKSEIITITGISPSTWNIRIRELISQGKVIRQGDRRDTRYSLSA